MDWMQASWIQATWLPLVVSPIVGSLLGLLVRRLPSGRPVALARSACESCGRQLGPAELIPVLSYAAQGGRCRGCGARIAPMHLYIELAAIGVAAVATAIARPEMVWAGCVLGWTLLALAWIDADTLLLPDVLTLPLIVAGLMFAWLMEPWTITDRALGAIVGYGAFRLIEIAYRRLRDRDGLGQGDAKLLAAAGAWLGWDALPWVVVLAALGGLLAAGIGWLAGGGRMTATTALPFGPPLAAATWALWLVAQPPFWMVGT
jgi:leader peptidase (prepilin peptidase)/N-methyltransferase